MSMSRAKPSELSSNSIIKATSTRRALHRFSELSPLVFDIGDIVEAQVSFIVVPLKGQNYKIQTVMHSIALLDSQFSKVHDER